MRRVGTISAAAGFIFLGFWMIVNQRNPYMGDMIFRWWPTIIILLGVELLLSFSHRDENHRIHLNGLVIPVILLFLFVNVFRGASTRIGEGFRWLKNSRNFNEVVDILRNIDDNNYKIIETSKILEPHGSSLVIDTNNGDVNINKSQDGKVKLEARIYVDKNSNKDNYNIQEEKGAEGYKIKIDESYVKKVRMDLYIPDGMNLMFEGNNVRLISDYELSDTKFSVDVNNASIDIHNAESVNFKINNGKVDIKDVKNILVKSSNAVVNVGGNAETIDLDISNGMVSIENKTSKNVNVKMDSGTVKIKTDDQNVDVKLQLDHGPCVLNGERRINAGIVKVFGSGENKVKVDVDNGMITFLN